MPRALTPAARRSYSTYVHHLEKCLECPKGRGRCPVGANLARAYLTATKKH
ncbi:hypothetical protein QFZ75_000012 [Streptomyces sp. V3I8]|nr:hypothetical protein [Streptomyces sp. V3I8]